MWDASHRGDAALVNDRKRNHGAVGAFGFDFFGFDLRIINRRRRDQRGVRELVGFRRSSEYHSGDLVQEVSSSQAPDSVGFVTSA